MRVARIVLTAMAVLVAVAVSQVGVARQAEAAPTGPAITWQYSAEANAYWRSPEATPSPDNDGPLLVWTQFSGTYEITCPDGDPAYACDQGTSYVWCNPDIPGDTGLPRFAHIRYERAPDPETGEMGPWIGSIAGSGCSEPGDEDVITMDEIREQMLLTADVVHGLPEPEPAIKPAPTGLVNLPVIVSTDYPSPDDPAIADVVVADDPVRLLIPIVIDGGRYPFIGSIEAWLDDYVWTFKDGTGNTVKTVSGRGPGTPYNPSVDPKTNPDYYISHTYREVSTANTVLVNMTWVGEVRVDGLDIVQPMIPVPVQGASDPFTVVEAKSVLGDQ